MRGLMMNFKKSSAHRGRLLGRSKPPLHRTRPACMACRSFINDADLAAVDRIGAVDNAHLSPPGANQIHDIFTVRRVDKVRTVSIGGIEGSERLGRDFSQGRRLGSPRAMRMVRSGNTSRKEIEAAGEAAAMTSTREVCAKIRGPPLIVSPFCCSFPLPQTTRVRNTSMGAPCSICRRSVCDGPYTACTVTPYSSLEHGHDIVEGRLSNYGPPQPSGLQREQWRRLPPGLRGRLRRPSLC